MAKREKLDYLAIAAHPDDIEIACGGLLIKAAKQGYKTGALDLTRGEMGTQGNEHDRARELADAAKIMELTWRGNLELPDSAVENNKETRLKLAQEIRSSKAEVVILPHWAQRHPDHLACCRLGYDACFLAGLRKADLEGEPHRPRKILYVSYFRNTDFTFLVDISDVMKQKLEAIRAYTSQFGDSIKVDEMFSLGSDDIWERRTSQKKDIFHPGETVFDLLITRQRALGQMVGVRFAEAYTIKEQLLIDNPFALPVRSI